MLRDSIAKIFKVDRLISHLTGYIETRVELLKIEAKEELSKGLSKVLFFLLLSFVFALVMIFLSIAIALEIGVRMGNFAGFAIIAAVYLVIAIGLWLSRESLSAKFEEKIAEMFNTKKK